MMWTIVLAIVIAWLIILSLQYLAQFLVWALSTMEWTGTRLRTEAKKPVQWKAICLAVCLWGFLIVYLVLAYLPKR